MEFGLPNGLAEVAAALAVFLSAIISLVGTSARERVVSLGQARAAELCELTGILDPRVLQDVFGPPTMSGTWPTVTMERIRKARTPVGLLISDARVDYACMGVALAALVVEHGVLDMLLPVAVAVQVAGWVISSRLPRAV